MLNDLGLRLRYQRSDMVALTGRFLSHEVPTWEGVDRVCSVRYLRADVFQALQVAFPTWSTVETLCHSLRMHVK